MKLGNFDLNLLVALDVLLTERNVTRAAGRMFVSQPAMSNALVRLREQFNDQLLTRHGRELEITPLGQSLIAPVREFLLQARRLLEADYEFNPNEDSRTFRIAMSDYCAMILIGPLMKILSAEARELRCEISVLNERSAMQLVSGDLDMCVTGPDLRLLDASVDEKTICRSTLFSDSFVCAVDAEADPITGTLTLDEYLRLPHAVTRFGNATVSMEELAARRLELDLNILAVAPTFSTLPALIAGTPLLIAIQKKLADRLAASMPMHFYPPPIAIPDIVETLYWHQRSEHDKAHAWMRGAMTRASAAL